MYCIQYTYAHTHNHTTTGTNSHIENRIFACYFYTCSFIFSLFFSLLNRAISVCCSSQLHSVFVCCNFYTISIFLSTIRLSACFYLALEFHMGCFRPEWYRIEMCTFHRVVYSFFLSNWNLNRFKSQCFILYEFDKTIGIPMIVFDSINR